MKSPDLKQAPPPPVDLTQERQNGDLVRALINDGTVTACHDLSGGGLLVALAGMALAGNTGCDVSLPDGLSTNTATLFGEDQARYLLTTSAPDTVLSRAKEANVSAVALGTTGGTTLTVGGLPPISLEAMRDVHEGWLPSYMAAS